MLIKSINLEKKAKSMVFSDPKEEQEFINSFQYPARFYKKYHSLSNEHYLHQSSFTSALEYMGGESEN
jgi:hypothetical protein